MNWFLSHYDVCIAVIFIPLCIIIKHFYKKYLWRRQSPKYYLSHFPLYFINELIVTDLIFIIIKIGGMFKGIGEMVREMEPPGYKKSVFSFWDVGVAVIMIPLAVLFMMWYERFSERHKIGDLNLPHNFYSATGVFISCLNAYILLRILCGMPNIITLWMMYH
ncbi:MAG: hypothetical protein QM689_07270 [Oscillospiraceae bacterium]